MARYISAADTAKLVRQALKVAFPSFKGFSVRSRTYSGGASIDVSWTDGPTGPQVDRVVKPFAGSTFDGMIDLKTSHVSELNGEQVRYAADFVFTNRKESPEFLRTFIARVHAKYSAEWIAEAGIELKEDGRGGLYVDVKNYNSAYHFNKMRQNMLANGVVVELR